MAGLATWVGWFWSFWLIINIICAILFAIASITTFDRRKKPPVDKNDFR